MCGLFREQVTKAPIHGSTKDVCQVAEQDLNTELCDSTSKLA